MTDLPFDLLGYIDDRRAALRDSSPCSVCGHPEPARLNEDSCSECDGSADRLRQIVIEDTGGYVVVADVEAR